MPRPYTLEEVLNDLGISAKQALVNSTLLILASTSWVIETSYFDLTNPDFQCRYEKNSIQNTIILSALYLSMAVGGLIFGALADLRGRLVTLQMAVFINCYFTLFHLSLEEKFWQEFALKFILLFSCGGYMLVSIVYFAEQLPSHSRGVLLMVSIATGVLLGNLVLFYTEHLQDATLIWLIRRTSIFLLLFMTFFRGETIRYHEVVGNYDALMKQLHEISQANRKQIPNNLRFVSVKDPRHLGNPKPIFTRKLMTTFALSLLFGFTFTSSQQTTLFNLMASSKRYTKTFDLTVLGNATESQICPNDTAIQHLPSYFIPFTALCKGVFLLLAAVSIKLFGKKLLLLLQIITCVGLNTSLAATKQDTAVNTILLCIASALNPVIWCTLFMFVTELYTTALRAVTFGFISFLGYLLMVIAALIMSGVLVLPYKITFLTLIVFNLLSGILVTLLPTHFTTRLTNFY